jgi:wobble nucleotide-excising tRNase
MIKKILSIKNLGKYRDINPKKYSWNGILEKVNVIYAPNGSGKTTLSILFKSLVGANHLLIKKHSFLATDPISVVLLGDDNKEIKYDRGKWSRKIEEIEVFDSFYVEDNIYIISINREDLPKRFHKILLGDSGLDARVKAQQLHAKRKKLTNYRSSIKYSIKKKKQKGEDYASLEEKLKKVTEERDSIGPQIEALFTQSVDSSKPITDDYLSKINDYLRLLNPSIKLKTLEQTRTKFIYTIEINNHLVRGTNKSTHSLKFSLSEGDKTSLSLAFYFARLDMYGDQLSNMLVVFDDPISSFDYSRKNTTVNQLLKISRKCKQFILLTHDIQFAKDFSERNHYKNLNLKIVYDGASSQFDLHDIEYETLTGVFKDLTVLHEFINLGLGENRKAKDIKRSIRPVLEGYLRIKYFGVFDSKDWLGDMIKKCREDFSPKLSRMKTFIEEIEEINDYSKSSHHSNPYAIESDINIEELRIYSERTIELINRL